MSDRQTRARILVVLLVVGYGALGTTALAVSGGAFVSDGVRMGASDGPALIVDGDRQVYSTPFINETAVGFYPDDQGYITGDATQSELRVTSWNGTAEVADANVTPGIVKVNPASLDAVGVGGLISSASWDTVSVSDGDTDISYQSSGAAVIRVYGLAAGTTVRAQESGTVLDRTRVNADGTATFRDLPSGQHSIRVTQFSPESPQLTNVTPDGTEVLSTPITLSANVSDAEFPDDEVDVVFDVNGQPVYNETVTANTTVQYTLMSTPTAGDNTWTVEATDSVNTTTAQTQDLPLPANVTFRNESDTSEIIDTPITVTGTFLGSGETISERTTTNGSISTVGLPTDERFSLSATADGYKIRTVVVESLTSQQNVYLLPENKTAVEVEFEIDDATGNFPARDTSLIVEKPLTLNNETKYRAVAGGRFGASNSVPTLLEQDVTYRLKVQNGQQTRVLGEYTANQATIETLPIGNVEVTGQQDTGVAFSSSVVEEGGQNYVRTVYADESGNTSSVQVTVINKTNGQDEVISQSEASVSADGYVETVPVNSSTGVYEIQYDAVRDGQQISGNDRAGRPGTIDVPLDPRWSNLLGFVGIFMVGGLVVIVDSRAAAIVMSLLSIAFTLLGLVSIPTPVLGMAAAASLLWALGRSIV